MPLEEVPKQGDLIETQRGRFYLFQRESVTTGLYVTQHLTALQAERLQVVRGDWTAQYMSHNTFVKNYGNLQRLLGHNKPLSQIIEQAEEEETMTTLYELKGAEKETYGTKVGVKSDGKWLLEIKGTGDIISVDKNDLEEVLPYTVAVQYLDRGATGQKYHFISDKGLVEVGDLVILSKGSKGVAAVTAVDTKARQATIRLVGSVVKGTLIS